MYEAKVSYIDHHSETIVLEEDQRNDFIDALLNGLPYLDSKRDVVFWLPPVNIRHVVVKKKESHQCQKNQNSEQESDLKP